MLSVSKFFSGNFPCKCDKNFSYSIFSRDALRLRRSPKHLSYFCYAPPVGRRRRICTGWRDRFADPRPSQGPTQPAEGPRSNIKFRELNPWLVLENLNGIPYEKKKIVCSRDFRARPRPRSAPGENMLTFTGTRHAFVSVNKITNCGRCYPLSWLLRSIRKFGRISRKGVEEFLARGSFSGADMKVQGFTAAFAVV